jgi:hypothetical protein
MFEKEKMIEVAKTGRSKCRGCKQLIAKDEMRFGEEVDSLYGDGDIATLWYHLKCAAERRPNELRETLDKFQGKIPGRAELDQLLANNKGKKAGGGGGKYPYAEKAPSGRSKCLKCDKTIDKDSIRVAVEREVEIAGVMRPSAGYLHPGCAVAFTGDKKLGAALKTNSKLTDAELAPVLKQL